MITKARPSSRTRRLARGGARGSAVLAEGALDGDDLAKEAAAGERGVSVGEIEEAHLAVAEGEGRAVVLGVLGQRSHPEIVEALEQAGGADGVGGDHRGHVVGVGEGLADAHRAVEAAVVVVGVVVAVARREVELDVGEDRRGGVPEPLHAELVDEGLERRARLAEREDAVIVAEARGVLDVGRADVGEDLAAGVVEDDDGRGADVAGREALHGLLRQDLELALEAAIDGEGELRGAVAERAEGLVEGAGHQPAHEVRRAGSAARGRDDQRLALGVQDLVARREAGLGEAIEDAVAPAEKLRGAARGIVDGGPARDAGERGGLGEREIVRGLVEVEAARGLDPAQPGAEADAVDVLLEDLALAQRPLDAQGEGGLGNLPRRVRGRFTSERASCCVSVEAPETTRRCARPGRRRAARRSDRRRGGGRSGDLRRR